MAGYSSNLGIGSQEPQQIGVCYSRVVSRPVKVGKGPTEIVFKDVIDGSASILEDMVMQNNMSDFRIDRVNVTGLNRSQSLVPKRPASIGLEIVDVNPARPRQNRVNKAIHGLSQGIFA
jgi:hypothetical protein